MKTKSKLKMTILLGAAICLMANIGFAQNFNWGKIYDTWTDDFARSVAYDANGNVYSVGTTYYLQTRIGVVKYNASGIQQWAYLDSPNGSPNNDDDQGYGVTVDGAGNVYAVGQKYINATQKVDIILLKLNSSGVLQWSRSYGSTFNGHERAYSIVVDGSGNSYITGRIYVSATTSDIITIKYNSAGTLQWATPYTATTTGIDEGRVIKRDGSGNLYVAGLVHNGAFLNDWIVIKYNSSGVQQWATLSNYYGANDAAFDLQIDGSGNSYIGGYVRDYYIAHNDDGLIVKLNSSGVQQWWREFDDGGLSRNQQFHSIAIDGTNVYATGFSEKNSTGTDIDYATVSYSTSGAFVWASGFDDSAPSTASNDKGGTVAVTCRGIYVTGTSEDVTTKKDITTLRLDPTNGSINWQHSFDYTGDGTYIGDDQLGGAWLGAASVYYTRQAMAVRINGNVDEIYIAGTSFTDPSAFSGAYDYITLKYTYNTACTQGPQGGGRFVQMESEIDPVTSLVLYPNPVFDHAIIKINPDVNIENAQFIIYDMLGKEVKSVSVNQAETEIQLDKNIMHKGIYFYKMINNNEILESGKLIMQ